MTSRRELRWYFHELFVGILIAVWLSLFSLATFVRFDYRQWFYLLRIFCWYYAFSAAVVLPWPYFLRGILRLLLLLNLRGVYQKTLVELVKMRELRNHRLVEEHIQRRINREVDSSRSGRRVRMEPITDHMRNVSLNHRAAAAAMSSIDVATEAEEEAKAVAAAAAIEARGGEGGIRSSITKDVSSSGGSKKATGGAPAPSEKGFGSARSDGLGGSTSKTSGAAMDVDKDGAGGDEGAGAVSGYSGAGTDAVNGGRGGGSNDHNDRTDSTSRAGRRSRSHPDPAGTVSYNAEHIIGNGSFGVVFQAVVVETGEVVAIKKVLQDKRFKNRELQIMRMLVKKEHPNIVRLKHCFYSNGDKADELYLNLVLEFVPETVYSVARQYHKSKQTLPLLLVKLYLYQLARALGHIHALGICHRDIKPQNLLLNPQTHILKLCDFGSAKILVRGEPNVSYICSRYYRAPELIFGSTDYTCAIDTWSLGCVAAELLLGEPLFPGDSGVDQLVEIIKVLGTPTREEIRAMNYNYSEFKFPQIKAHPWKGVFRSRTPPEALDVVSRMLAYDPSRRIKPLEACSHEFVHELRQEGVVLPNGKPLPPLFEFTELELSANPRLLSHILSSTGRAKGTDGAGTGGVGDSRTRSGSAASGAAATGVATGGASASAGGATTIAGTEAGVGQA